MLDYHFVAFLDILGYSNMVKSDLEGPSGEEKYFDKLLQLHKEAASLKYDNLDFNIIQFSDSIIIAAPFDLKNFHSFSKLIGEYQFRLLLNGILIRGGVTYGKHFFKDDFLFSSALIDAYKLEQTLARFPRIIVSNDLIDLLENSKDTNLEYIISDHNYRIIDFLHGANIDQETIDFVSSVVRKLEENKTETVSEKGLWLKEYLSFYFPKRVEEYARFKKNK